MSLHHLVRRPRFEGLEPRLLLNGTPILSIDDDVLVREGATDVTGHFDVSLTEAPAFEVWFNYEVTDGTAVEGVDYTVASGSGYIMNPSTTATIPFTVLADAEVESDETFSVTITSATGATIGDGDATATIVDAGDDTPRLSINDVTKSEGSGHGFDTYFTFTVDLFNPSTDTVTVDYVTADDTAVASSDYYEATDTLTFAPSETSKTLSVIVNNDTRRELDETFFVNLSDPANAIISDGQGVGTIENDDLTPLDATIDNLQMDEGDVDSADMIFTVEINGEFDQQVSVTYQTYGDPFGFGPTPGVDYVETSGTLDFAPGETTKTFAVTVFGDLNVESDELFEVLVKDPATGTTFDVGHGTILNDDGADIRKVLVSDPVMSEDGGGLIFEISLTTPPQYGEIYVNYATADPPTGNAATAGVDYVATTGTAWFMGNTSSRVTVPIINDAVTEGDEVVHLELGTISGYFGDTAVYGDNLGVGTILDGPGALPTLSIADGWKLEGETTPYFLELGVTLSAPSDQFISFDYSTADNTAVGAPFYPRPGDYQIYTSQTRTFAPGETSKTIHLEIYDDDIDEGQDNETFFVNLSNAIGATIDDGHAVVAIVDDDHGTPVEFSISGDTDVNEGDVVHFTVSVTGTITDPVTVRVDTIDDVAVEGDDFAPLHQTLTFTPGGPTSIDFTIQTFLDNDGEEGCDPFLVRLSDPSSGSIAVGQIVPHICEGMPLPTMFSIGDAEALEGSAASGGQLTFNVYLSREEADSVTVDYATSGGSAVEGTDYTAASGTLTFGPGDTLKNVTVDVLGDSDAESDETFTVTLSNPTAFVLIDDGIGGGSGVGTGTILNDDVPPPPLEFFITANPTVNEGDVIDYTVSMSRQPTEYVEVTVTVGGGTATFGSDYTGGCTIGFNPGDPPMVQSVYTVTDELIEGDETFNITLANPVGGVIGAEGEVTVTILDPPPLEFFVTANPTVNEGDVIDYTVSMSRQPTEMVWVDVLVPGGTATFGTDYGGGCTIGFNPGDPPMVQSVHTVTDELIEGDETFNITLANPSAGRIGTPGEVTVTIVDPPPLEFSISADPVVLEGDLAYYTVSLSRYPTEYVEVLVDAGGGTATEGVDYVGDLTIGFYPLDDPFVPAFLAWTASVSTIPDTLVEGYETYNLTLTNPSAGRIANGQATTTILDANTPPMVAIDDVSLAEGDTGTTDFVFTVTRPGPTDQALTKYWETVGDVNVLTNDLNASSGAITFAAGEATTTITVEVIGDLQWELDDTFGVAVAGNPPVRDPVTGDLIGDMVVGTGTILNDDGEPTISIDDVEQLEGDTLGSVAEFTVSLSRPSSQQVSVDYGTANGTAEIADYDYAWATGTVNFFPGETSKPVRITVVPDLDIEPDETFFVNLSDPTGATLADDQGLATILDDDTPPPVTFSVNDATVIEGDVGQTDMVFEITLSVPQPTVQSVFFETTFGTAGYADYGHVGELAAFNPGQTVMQVVVPIFGDTDIEGNEAFTFELTADPNSFPIIGDGEGVGTILDDDGPPIFSITGDAMVDEGHLASYTVSYIGELTAPATVQLDTEPGTTLTPDATEGVDFDGQHVTIAFVPGGARSMSYWVQTHIDMVVEGDEEFAVSLSNPSEGIIDYGSFDTVIVDTTPPPPPIEFSITGSQSVTEGDTAIYTISYTGVLAAPATVKLDTGPGLTLMPDATEGVDFDGEHVTIAFVPGGTASMSYWVQTHTDTLLEGAEEFTVNLSNPSEGVIVTVQAETTILDAGAVGVILGDLTITEGAPFQPPITLTAPHAQAIDIPYSTTFIHETGGRPYITKSGVFRFDPGDTTTPSGAFQTVMTPADEGDDIWTINLGAPQIGGSPAADVFVIDGQGLMTILDGGNVISPPVITNLTVTPSPVDENGTVTLDGTFIDANLTDTHTVTIDWGDGSTPTEFVLPVGNRAFQATHPYLDDNPTATPADDVTITVTVDDGSGAAGGAPAPLTGDLNADGKVNLTDLMILKDNFGQTGVGLPGDISGDGLVDLTDLMVLRDNFGSTAPPPAGGDPPSGQATETVDVTVNNVDPDIVNLLADPDPIYKDTSTNLSGGFTHPATLDDHEVTIDWGDGTAPTVLNATVGGRVFDADHIYGPTGTGPQDVYTVTVTVTDDDTGTDQMTTTITVINGVLIDGFSAGDAGVTLDDSEILEQDMDTQLPPTDTHGGTRHIQADWQGMPVGPDTGDFGAVAVDAGLANVTLGG